MTLEESESIYIYTVWWIGVATQVHSSPFTIVGVGECFCSGFAVVRSSLCDCFSCLVCGRH